MEYESTTQQWKWVTVEEISIEGEGVEELDKKLVYQDIELSWEETSERSSKKSKWRRYW